MRLLVISHNVFSDTTNMGKTLSSYFKNWHPDELAQLYIHSEVPTSGICENYFRITDKEALESIFTRKCGRTFGKDDIDIGRATSRTDTGLTAQIYQFGRKRSPMIYLARNAVWRFSAWKSRKLLKWMDDFAPDAVFFASGDYSFMYRIALEIAKRRNIPLYVTCMDDYYLNNMNKDSMLGRFAHCLFMRQIKRAMERAENIFVICDKMAEDYSKLFGKECHVLHTPASFEDPLHEEKKGGIAYLGNLGLNRHKQLTRLGRALKELNMENAPKTIDVYSSEPREEILRELTLENGIVFHGAVSAGEVKQVIGESMAVIHTESFDETMKERVRYSVSTKIADSLASGTCLLVYGPSDVASVEYVKKNDAAFVITQDDDLNERLRRFLKDGSLRNQIVTNALDLAKRNHGVTAAGDIIRNVIEKHRAY